MLLAGTGVSGKKLTVFYSTNKNESHGMNKKVSIATLSAFLVATSPAMAVNEANTLYVNLELSLNRTTVGMIIQSISEQTGYEFSYDESILSKEISKVSVRVKNEHIESVLKKVFKNTDISYRIVDNRIFLQDNAKTENVSFASVQQVKRTIRGTVVDNTGLPVIGVKCHSERKCWCWYGDKCRR